MNIKLQLGASFWDSTPYEYFPSQKLKKIWAVELDLLHALDTACTKLGVSFFLVYGSLLGAKRHGGIIPWDDDIDVGMLRRDYDYLCDHAGEVFQEPYFWQTNQTDPGSARGHAQLRNSETTGILRCEMVDGRCRFSFNQGIFIDIFAFDNVPDDESERKVFQDELLALKDNVARHRQRQYDFNNFWKGQGFWGRARILLKESWPQLKEKTLGINLLTDACLRLDAHAKKYKDRGTGYVAPVTFMPKSDRFCPIPVSMLTRLERVSFNGLQVPAPVDYEYMLKRCYGDWHEHVVGGSVHGGVLFDVDRPYIEYLQK